jgi:hypothetical protein
MFRARVVVLDKSLLDSDFGKAALAVALEKKAAIVLKDPGF